MKKLTFLIASLLIAGTSFAQTTTTANGTGQTTSKTTHGTTVSTTAKADVSGTVATEAAAKGKAVSEVAKSRAKAKKDETSHEVKESAKAGKEKTKAKQEELKARHEEAKAQKEESLDAAAQARADLKAKAQREEQEEAAAQTNADLKVKAKTDVEVASQEVKNHGEAVSTVAKETLETGKEKGQAVKAAASEKRQRAGRIQTETGLNTKVNAGSASRAKVNTSLSNKGVRPVKVNAGANLKIGQK